MAQLTQLIRRVDSSMTVYNGSGADLAEGVACAFDPSNPPSTNVPPGVKITTSDSDYVGMTFTKIAAGATGSLQTRGVAIGTAGADITFGSTLSLMSDSSGHMVPRTSGKRTAGIPTISALSGEKIMFLMEPSNAT